MPTLRRVRFVSRLKFRIDRPWHAWIVPVALLLLVTPSLHPSTRQPASATATHSDSSRQAAVAPSPEHIRELIRNGSWPDAETEARQLLSVAESTSGADSLEAAQALDLL